MEPDWHPTKMHGILRESLDDELILYVPETEEVHLLNVTAAAVYELCDGTLSVGQIIETIASYLDDHPGSLATDTRKLLADFAEKKVIQ